MTGSADGDSSTTFGSPAPFGSGTHPVQVLVLTRPNGGWHVAGVYYRVAGGPVVLHQQWNESWGDTTTLEQDWIYLSGRVLDESGGNWYSYEVDGYEVGDVGEVAQLASTVQAQLDTDPSGKYALNPADVGGTPLLDQATPVVQPASIGLPGSPATPVDEPMRVSRTSPVPGTDPWIHPAIGLHRVLAAPTASEQLPGKPSKGTSLELSISYWSCLLHMLLYSLGWARPGRGLTWWLEAGRPVDDDIRLRLLAEIWGREGQLDWLAAHLWRQRDAMDHVFAGADRLHQLCGYQPITESPNVDRRWISEAERSAAESGIHNPLSGGSDPLYLEGHLAEPLAGGDSMSKSAVFTRTGLEERQATLVLDSLTGWYAQLAIAGQGLPHLGNRSWRVEVIVRPVGWLGTYRRSRITGLWFSGRHRHHVRGA